MVSSLYGFFRMVWILSEARFSIYGLRLRMLVLWVLYLRILGFVFLNIPQTGESNGRNYRQ